MNGFRSGRRRTETGLSPRPEPEVDPGFAEDATLLLLQWLAEQGVVAHISSGDRRTAVHELGWVFGASWRPTDSADLRSVVAEEATVEECVRILLPRLREAGLLVDEGPWGTGAGQGVSVEGTGVLVLDWLVEQGVHVFLKADGARRTPGWTFLARGGPLPEMLRVDGPGSGGCFRRMLPRLLAEGLVVPV